MKGKISVVINTYNAQKHLTEVLETVKDFDEIVVCDMESTDNTLAIARQYGCKIVTFPKENHSIVEPARNFAIQSASHDWVFVVDAGELLDAYDEVFHSDELTRRRQWVIQKYDPYLDGQCAQHMLEGARDYISRHGVPARRKLNLWRKYVSIKTFGRVKTNL